MNLVLKFLIYFAIGYGILVIVVYLAQRRMIYFPDRAEPTSDALHRAGLQFWPHEGEGYKGYTGVAAPKQNRGTVIVFHGNAGSAWHRYYYVHALVPLGYHVILAEYPGYGGRPGETSEPSFVRDARTIVLQAHSDKGGPVYLMGESMGCGVVAAVAADPPVPVAGLILITPWDSLPDLAQSLYWYLPARRLTRDRFDNVQHLRGYNRPVAVAIAGRDRIVPNKHSLRLFTSLTAPKQLWRFENAGHNNWPNHPEAPWWREAMTFVSGRQALEHQ